MNQPGRFTGIDLRPLPYESALSSLIRFAWRNRLNSVYLSRIAAQQRNYPVKKCDQSLDWIDKEGFKDASTWDVPSLEEQDFAQAFQLDHRVWIENSFRYCPLCFELGYHSFLHQFLSLNYCPWHQVPLSITCHQCGCPTPEYRFSASIFNSAYTCRHGHALSGVFPSVELYGILQAQSDAVERCFGPVYQWSIDSQSVRKSFDRLRIEELEASELLNSWCDVRNLIRSTCLELFPGNFPKQASDFSNVEIIEWNVRACDPKHDSPFYLFDRKNFTQRVKLPTAVYCCVLRSLQRWITTVDHLSQDDFNRACHLENDNVANYNPRVLALLCLRAQMEKQAWSLDENDISSACLRDEPNVEMPSLSRRTPRLGWRAYFIALYVSWYLRVLRSQNNKVRSMTFRHNSEGTDVLISCELESRGEEKWWVGRVFFPTINDEDFKSLVLHFGRRKAENLIPSQYSTGASVTPTIDWQRGATSLEDPTMDIFVRRIREEYEPRKGDGNTSPTERYYRFELDRLAIWAEINCAKWPSHLTQEECESYIEFLKDPQPFSFWKSKDGETRWGDHWRPFRKKLSYSSISRAIHVLNGYFTYIFSRRLGTTLDKVEIKQVVNSRSIRSTNFSKIVSLQEWLFLREELLKLDVNVRNMNVRMALLLLFETGRDLDSILHFRICDLVPPQHTSDKNESWAILDSNNLSSPISQVAYDTIVRSLQMRGIPVTDLSQIKGLSRFIFEEKEAYIQPGCVSRESFNAMGKETIDRHIKNCLREIANGVAERAPLSAALFARLTAAAIAKSGLATALQERLSLKEVRDAASLTNMERMYAMGKDNIVNEYTYPEQTEK